MKNSVKFSTESFSRSLKLLNFTEITEIFILTSERWEIHPKLYLNYNFCTISRKINLNLGKRGGLGGWRMRSRKFFGKFPKTWEKFPRKFREISGKRTGFTEIYWNLVKLLKFWNHWKFSTTEFYWNFQIPSKLFPLTEINDKYAYSCSQKLQSGVLSTYLCMGKHFTS